jgi:hypothetical protein
MKKLAAFFWGAFSFKYGISYTHYLSIETQKVAMYEMYETYDDNHKRRGTSCMVITTHC